jgi:hypothetical protein
MLALKLLGPVQEYNTAPLVAEALKLRLLPTHLGLLLVKLGTGMAVTVTLATALLVQPTALVAFTV